MKTNPQLVVKRMESQTRPAPHFNDETGCFRGAVIALALEFGMIASIAFVGWVVWLITHP